MSVNRFFISLQKIHLFKTVSGMYAYHIKKFLSMLDASDIL